MLQAASNGTVKVCSMLVNMEGGDRRRLQKLSTGGPNGPSRDACKTMYLMQALLCANEGLVWRAEFKVSGGGRVEEEGGGRGRGRGLGIVVGRGVGVRRGGGWVSSGGIEGGLGMEGDELGVV